MKLRAAQIAVLSALLGCQSEASAGSKHTKIPDTLLFTSKEDSLDQIPAHIKLNVDHTISLNSDLKVVYMGDKACLQYLNDNYAGSELPDIYRKTSRGSYRGDICRTAFLAKEGGYYVDLDIQVDRPLKDWVTADTEFMTATCEGQDCLLNAILIAAPNTPVMTETLQELKQWFYSPVPDKWMGPYTLAHALRKVEHNYSPGGIKLLSERKCIDCPAERMGFEGLRYALCDGTSAMGWARFAGCFGFGCGGNGWTEAPMTALLRGKSAHLKRKAVCG